jgi:hypothetical protein
MSWLTIKRWSNSSCSSYLKVVADGRNRSDESHPAQRAFALSRRAHFEVHGTGKALLSVAARRG